MKIKHFVIFVTIILLISCKQQTSAISKIKGLQISVNDSTAIDKEINSFILPYREHLNASLESILCYSPRPMDKDDGKLESTIGNMMADMLIKQAGPVFEKRHKKSIDFCLLNHGGIRAVIPKGNISMRTAYQVMPFENTIVVVELTGEKVKEMINYLAKAKRAHPISGLRLKLDSNFKPIDAKINGKPIDHSRTYLVVTSNYLLNLGDNMNFFADPVKVYDIDYKIRNAMIDYFTEIDTLKAELDNRFIQL